MARPVPARLVDKVRLVQAAVGIARGDERRHFDLTSEIAPGVRLIMSELGGLPLVLSLWSLPQDIAGVCGDASYPATAALLAVDAAQARELITAGHLVDLAQFTASAAVPGLYYALLDHASPRQIHAVLHRLVPALETHTVAA